MGHYNGKITAPVSIYDIQQVLGESSSDDGTLCRSNNVNMWAKYKPVRWPEPDTNPALNQARTGWNPSAPDAYAWWKSIDGNYGLNYSGGAVDLPFSVSGMKTALENLANNKINGGLNGWIYQKPSGSQVIIGDPVEPYRFFDFLQYNHRADNPIRSVTSADVRAGSNSYYSVVVNYIETAPSDITTRDYIRPDDLMGSGVTLYRGLAIFKKDTSTNKYVCRGWCTGKEWKGQGIKSAGYSEDWVDGQTYAVSYLVAAYNNVGADYYVLPLFFTCELAQGTNGENHNVCAPNTGYKAITVPYTGLVKFEVYQSSRTPVLSNKQITTDGDYIATLSINNSGSAAQNVGYWAAVVNENFTGPTGSQSTYKAKTEGTLQSLPTSPPNTIIPDDNGLLTTFDIEDGSLGTDHTWRVYLNLSGTEYYIPLIQPAQPAQQ